MSTFRPVAAAVLTALTWGSAQAGLVVDTPVQYVVYSFYQSQSGQQSLATAFHLDAATTVSSLSGFFWSSGGGSATISLISGADPAGAALYSSSFNLAGNGAPSGTSPEPVDGSWSGVDGLALSLGAGDYILEFTPSNGLSAVMGHTNSAAVRPGMSDWYRERGNWQPFMVTAGALAIRVEGELQPTTSTLPEPSSLALVGLALAAVTRRRVKAGGRAEPSRAV